MLCLHCQSPTKNPKFCSRSCSAIFTNSTQPKQRKQGVCLVCSNPCRKARKYCSTLCYNTTRKDTKRTPEEKKEKNRKSVLSHHKKLKLKGVAYKGGACESCGYNKCIAALCFHHKDPTTKDFTFSGKSISWDRAKKELDKCILLCANCHQELHYFLRQNT